MSEGPRGGGIEPRARANSVENDAMQVSATVEPRANSAKVEGQEMMRQAEDEIASPAQTLNSMPTEIPTLETQPVLKTVRRRLSGSPILSPQESQAPEIRYRQHFGQRPLEPPVTKGTLSELDVPKIINNHKLRHDINFDPELHFRPNLDGEKGRRKTEKAALFWDTLESQLLQFTLDPHSFYHKHGSRDDWCLPKLLKAIKDIIQTLVPARDREVLEEGLSVELLMQQFYKGVADLEKMAAWIRRVLKLHCAPMRDEWVDRTYEELRESQEKGDMQGIVSGLRSLLSLLEAMKLDVANHQIRCLRSVLIEDTVHFEQRFFLRKMQGHKLKRIPDAKEWYAKAVTYGSGAGDAQAFGDSAVFFNALSQLILPTTPADIIPETFVFDEERISKLRSDALDSINLEVCMRLYEDLEKMSRLKLTPAYVDEEMTGTGTASMDVNFFAPSSRPSSLALSLSDSDNSSPRNSWCIVSPPRNDANETRAKARNVYNSLLALLQTMPSSSSPQKRWQDLLEAIAYQIFRFVNVPQDIFPVFQRRLAACLSGASDDGLFTRVEEQFHARLLLELGKRVKDFKSQSGSALFALAAGNRMHPAGRLWEADAPVNELADVSGSSGGDLREDGGVGDMAMRLAHLGILHWRVWSSLLYLSDGEVEVAKLP